MKKTFLKNKKNVQFLIIGLGLIGGSIAKRLSKRGFEVLAIDKNKPHLKYAKKSKIIVGSSEKTDCEKKLFPMVLLYFVDESSVIPSLSSDKFSSDSEQSIP